MRRAAPGGVALVARLRLAVLPLTGETVAVRT
jgi:hypothetical protein